MSDLHIGCDPGQKGSLVALSTLKGDHPISILRMPMQTVQGTPQLNVRAVVDWVLEIYPRGDCHVWIEKCPRHMPSAAVMRSYAIIYGRLLGIFEARFPHMHVHRVECGRILAGWQRQSFGTFDKTNSKQKALELAQQIWPGMEWPADRNGKPYDGPVDAAILANWGRCQIEGEPCPTLATQTLTSPSPDESSLSE